MTGWRILCGGLVFVAVSAVTAAGLATLAGKIEVRAVWIALVLGAVAAALTFREARAPRQRITWADAVLFVVFALASLRAFLWVVYAEGPDIEVLSPHNLGDVALHLNLIQRWANGGTFWPENPFLAGEVFPYHPGMDFWNAMLRVAGVPVFEGLRWVGLLGAVAAAAALWRWGRGFTVAAFLFVGGLGAVTVLQTGVLDGMLDGVAWKNAFLTMFVTQRGMLYSLPAGLVLLTVWRSQLRAEQDGPQLPQLAQAALYASMPFFNAPAFLFLSLVLATCALAAWRRKLARPFFAVGLISVIPASWLVHMVTVGFTAPSAFRFDPGWMMENEGVWFWLWNFGAFLPLVAVGAFLLFRRGSADVAARVFYATGTATLVFCFLFLVAPWPWDNTKLIIWGYLAVIPFLWSDLLRRWSVWAQAVACFLLFASGALSLLGGLDARHGYKIADREELAEMQVMLRSIPVNARLATAPSYEHPALLLGQPVVMGHDGHLFSQGLDYTAVQTDLDTLMNGDDRWRDAARDLRVHYLFWGKREAERWPSSRKPWLECARKLTESPNGAIYLITPCLLED
jgi:hypothetical protein